MLIACDKIPIIDQVIDGLYVGDVVAANNLAILKEKKITVVISMIHMNSHFENIKYHSFPIDDNRNENISIYFEEINTIISESIKDKNILVHCENGVSRSVTIILAYLLKNNITLKEAFYLLKNSRTSTFTRPNSGFAKQLLKYEKKLFSVNSISLSEILG